MDAGWGERFNSDDIRRLNGHSDYAFRKSCTD
jgi:hypothetical protein